MNMNIKILILKLKFLKKIKKENYFCIEENKRYSCKI